MRKGGLNLKELYSNQQCREKGARHHLLRLFHEGVHGEVLMTFGEQLKAARAKVGMSQDVLSARTRIAKSFIQKLEVKGGTPSVMTLARLVEVLKVRFEWEHHGRKMVFGYESEVKK